MTVRVRLLLTLGGIILLLVIPAAYGVSQLRRLRDLAVELENVHAEDIFAVGTCMYEMLTSERLFMGESDFSTLERVRNADVAPVQNVVADMPMDLAQIVMRALSREPGDRFQTAADLQEALMTLPPEQRRWPRALAGLGVLGCAGLALALPLRSVVTGAAVLALGALVYVVRSRHLPAQRR